MSTLGKSPQFGIYQRMDAITGTSDSSYTLKIDTVPQTNFIAEQLIVSVNGVIQAPNSAYTVTGSTITFSEAIDSTDAIDFITAMGNAHSTNTVSDNTVTAAKLNDAIGITNTPIRKNTNRICLLYTSPSPRDGTSSRMPSSA